MKTLKHPIEYYQIGYHDLKRRNMLPNALKRLKRGLKLVWRGKLELLALGVLVVGIFYAFYFMVWSFGLFLEGLKLLN